MGDPEHDKLSAPADFDGPTKNRHCTDLLCLLMLIGCWVATTGVGIYAVTNGDYRLVLYPMDYDGNICGTDFAADMRDYPNLLFVNSYTGGVCVKECPDLTGQVSDNATDVRTLITYAGIWQASGAQLPAHFIQVGNYTGSPDAHTCTYTKCYPNNSPQASWYSDGVRASAGYAFYAGSSYSLLNRCFLTDQAKRRITEQVNASSVTSESLTSAVDSAYDVFTKLYADLWTARAYILGVGFGAGFGVSFIYIFLMRLPFLLNFMVWASIFITIGLFIGGGYYAWKTASDWDDEVPQTVDDTTIQLTTIAAIVLWVIGGILFLLMVCLRKAIALAIGCVKEAGKAVNNMILILLIPFLQAVGLIIFLIVFLVYAVHLASLGTITTEQVPLPTVDPNNPLNGIQTDTAINYRVYTFDDFVTRCGWFLLFSLFWTANFITALGDLMIAVSVAKWYFTRNKLLVGSWTVIGSITETLFYHSGTCAYGSLILAIIQIIRTAIAKAQKHAKETHNKILQYLLCCCQCCFWCLEKCIKFVNKNAYVQTAIFSTSFCRSCRESFYLFVRNFARVGAVSYVSAAVLIVGKLFISSVVTGFGYIIITEQIQDELYSVAGPVVVIFFISYVISDFAMDVLDMGILTVLHCLIADEEMFDGDQVYAEKSLQRFLDTHN